MEGLAIPFSIRIVMRSLMRDDVRKSNKMLQVVFKLRMPKLYCRWHFATGVCIMYIFRASVVVPTLR